MIPRSGKPQQPPPFICSDPSETSTKGTECVPKVPQGNNWCAESCSQEKLCPLVFHESGSISSSVSREQREEKTQKYPRCHIMLTNSHLICDKSSGVPSGAFAIVVPQVLWAGMIPPFSLFQIWASPTSLEDVGYFKELYQDQTNFTRFLLKKMATGTRLCAPLPSRHAWCYSPNPEIGNVRLMSHQQLMRVGWLLVAHRPFWLRAAAAEKPDRAGQEHRASQPCSFQLPPRARKLLATMCFQKRAARSRAAEVRCKAAPSLPQSITGGKLFFCFPALQSTTWWSALLLCSGNFFLLLNMQRNQDH